MEKAECSNSYLSSILKELLSMNLVEELTGSIRGKIYALTNDGKTVIKKIEMSLDENSSL